MSNKLSRMFSAKTWLSVKRTLERNPYALGATASLLALGVLTEVARRSPRVRDRGRELKSYFTRLLSRPRVANESEMLALNEVY